MPLSLTRLSLTRRHLAAGVISTLGINKVSAAAAEQNAVAQIEERYGGRLGVFAIDTGSGRTLSYRPDERFTMCSTFKGLLAAQVLARVDAGMESLTRVLHYNEGDLSAAGYPDYLCPITAENVKTGALTLGTLCQSIVGVSDNLAAILLMRSAGGPAGLTSFIRSLGDETTRSDRYEPLSNDYDGVLDTTTPRAIIGSARAILLGRVLSPESRELLESWMIDSKTGLRRLRACCPPEWLIGDKTGTSGEEETNDYAIVRPPGREPLLVAVYYDAPKVDLDRREAVLREAGTVFVRWAG